MQKVTREQLIAKASQLLSDGTVSLVLGWSKGEFDYDVTPAMFRSVEELNDGFVFNDFCGANFAKYLVTKAANVEGKVLVFLKQIRKKCLIDFTDVKMLHILLKVLGLVYI